MDTHCRTLYFYLLKSYFFICIIVHLASGDAEPVADPATLYLPPTLVLTPPAATTVIATPRISLDHTIIQDPYQGNIFYLLSKA